MTYGRFLYHNWRWRCVSDGDSPTQRNAQCSLCHKDQKIDVNPLLFLFSTHVLCFTMLLYRNHPSIQPFYKPHLDRSNELGDVSMMIPNA